MGAYRKQTVVKRMFFIWKKVSQIQKLLQEKEELQEILLQTHRLLVQASK